MAAPTTVLITGANSGIGLATAQVLGLAGYHVIMTGRSLPKVEQARATLLSSTSIPPDALSTLALDVTSGPTIAAAAAAVAAKHGSLDVLINNAGLCVMDADGTNLAADMTKTIATNVTGPALVTQAFLPLLLKSAAPYLLYVSSGLGSLAMSADPSVGHYGAGFMEYRVSKAALNMVVVQDHKNLKDKGVKVYAVCPGLVESGLRGEGEEARTMGGRAGDPTVSGRTMMAIIKGERDADVGRFVHKDGVYPW